MFAESDLIELARAAAGVCHRLHAVADVRVRHDLALLVLAVEEPQASAGHETQDGLVERLHVLALLLRLRGDVGGDLLLDGHAPSMRHDSFARQQSGSRTHDVARSRGHRPGRPALRWRSP